MFSYRNDINHFVLISPIIRQIVYQFILPMEIQKFPEISFPLTPDNRVDVPELILTAWKQFNWRQDSYLGDDSTKRTHADGSEIRRGTLAPSEYVYHFQFYAMLKRSLPHRFQLFMFTNFRYGLNFFFSLDFSI